MPKEHNIGNAEKNLIRNYGEISVSLEKHRAHVAEYKNEAGENENLPGFDFSTECERQNESYVKSIFDTISLFDSFDQVKKELSEIKEKESKMPDNCSVTYLKNTFSDEAYNAFSAFLKNSRVAYSDSFTDVCESVYYNKSDACILPIENSDEGRLPGFDGLIRKYELKIVMTCNIDDKDGHFTKFALLSKSQFKAEVPEKLSFDRFFKISVRPTPGIRLRDVLLLAGYFGEEINKIDSIPEYYSENGYVFDLTFCGNGNTDGITKWLDKNGLGYEIRGKYVHIKK